MMQRKMLIIVGLLIMVFVGTAVSDQPADTSISSSTGLDPASAQVLAMYQKLRSNTLSGDSLTVQDLVLKRDIATMTFTSGTFHFMSPVEGQVMGAVFVGQGVFQMTPTPNVEKRHLRHLTGISSISESFDRMVLWFTDATYDDIIKTGSTRTGAPSSGATGYLKENRKLLRKGWTYTSYNIAAVFMNTNLELRLLQDLSWPDHGGMFYAYFHGKTHGDMLFAVDPLGAAYVKPEEVVLVGLDDDFLGIWTAQHFQSHYQRQPEPRVTHDLVDMEHVIINATTNKEHLDASVKIRYTALADGVRVIPLDLYQTLRMRRTTDDHNRSLAFIQEDKDDDPDFAVILAEGLKKGQKITLTFEYSGDDAMKDEGGKNYMLLARSNWFPHNGITDRATYEMTFTFPKGLTMVATGEPVDEKKKGKMVVSRWKSDVPLAVAGFNYGKFKKKAITDKATGCNVEAYANKHIPDVIQGIIKSVEFNEQLIHRQTGRASSSEWTMGKLDTVKLMNKARSEAQIAIQLYSDFYGPMPFDRLAVSQQTAVNFGQAWPMLVYMPLTAFLDSTQRHELGFRYYGNFLKFITAHETAHQWWGHRVGWQSYRDQWLSEGLADFSASLFAQVVYKNEAFIEFWDEALKWILNKNIEGTYPLAVGSVTMGQRLDTRKTGNVSKAIVYDKAAYIFHMLRMIMRDRKTGDVRFSEMMKDFAATYTGRNATTDDFKRMVEKHIIPEMNLDGNGKMDWFFNQWVYGIQIPVYKLNYTLEPAANGKTRFRCTVSQRNVTNDFKMRVPIYLDFNGKVIRLGSVVINGNSSSPEIDVELPKNPSKVLLCAYKDVLCVMDD